MGLCFFFFFNIFYFAEVILHCQLRFFTICNTNTLAVNKLQHRTTWQHRENGQKIPKQAEEKKQNNNKKNNIFDNVTDARVKQGNCQGAKVSAFPRPEYHTSVKEAAAIRQRHLNGFSRVIEPRDQTDRSTNSFFEFKMVASHN